jgi:SAM-dependent methyltransferase
VSDVVGKYDAMAEMYSSRDYADPERYYARRADLVIRHGPRLCARDTVLDIACGDGGLGRHLLARGIDYRGVDASAKMVEVARRALGDRVVQGTFEYAPPQPVDATTIFRSLYLVPDRRAFLEHVRGFTRTKLVFDLDPRAVSLDDLLGDVQAAGWGDVRVRPFLLPQRVRVAAPVAWVLSALEPLPGARLVTRVHFPLLVSASA